MAWRRHLATRAWGVGLVLTMLVGCGSGDGPIPFPEFESTALTAVCRLEVLCGTYPNPATCMTSEQTQPHFYDTLAQDIASGKVNYDGALARTCIDTINGLSSCNRSTVGTINLIPTCNEIFAGTVAVGDACFFAEECSGGGACLSASGCSSGQCCAGTCQSPTMVVVPLGSNCSSSDEFCAAGSFCLPDSTSGGETCQKGVAVGGPCTSSNVCASGLYCDPTSGTCQGLVATGGACKPSLDSQDCDSAADYCDAATSICRPFVRVGSPCSDATSICVPYAVCDPTSGLCIARPEVGGFCNTVSPSCLTGSCDVTSSTCVLLPTAGACS